MKTLTLNQRLVLAGLGIALAATLIDILWHSHSSEVDASSPLPELPVKNESITQASYAIPAVFVAQVEAPEEPIAQEPEAPGLSQQQELAQQGLLKQLQAGERVYRLSAISIDSQPSAVMAVTDLYGAAQKRMVLSTGDNLGAYQVERITPRSIYFSRNNTQQWLQVFTPLAAVAQEQNNK